jgi:hypothetical protein
MEFIYTSLPFGIRVQNQNPLVTLCPTVARLSSSSLLPPPSSSSPLLCASFLLRVSFAHLIIELCKREYRKLMSEKIKHNTRESKEDEREMTKNTVSWQTPKQNLIAIQAGKVEHFTTEAWGAFRCASEQQIS